MNIRHTTTLYVLPGGLSSGYQKEIRKPGGANAPSDRSNNSSLTRTSLPELRLLPNCGAEIHFEPALEQHNKIPTSNLGPSVETAQGIRPAVQAGRRTKCDTVLKRLSEVDAPYEEDQLLVDSAVPLIMDERQISEEIFDRFVSISVF